MFDTKVGVGLWQWLKCFALTGGSSEARKAEKGWSSWGRGQ